MQTTFLEYYKQILAKVSFDLQLLKKEYHKALQLLQESEVEQLNEWMAEQGLYTRTLPVDRDKGFRVPDHMEYS